MEALSPMESAGSAHGNMGPSSNYGSGESSGARSPLAMNLSFIKSIAEKKTTTRDGQPPKRRGPKPDSKPALTRRQELNRQAQRTHRERKEVYIKNLEDQLVQLRETFTGAVQERNSVAEENRRLKEVLRAHGIADSPFDGYSISGGEQSAYAGSVADSRASSYPYTSAFSPAQSTISGGNTSPGLRQMQRPSVDMFGPLQGGSQQQQQQQQPMPGQPRFQPGSQPPPAQQQQPQQGGMDHDQLGIEFVLALERPCMVHATDLCVKSSNSPSHEPVINGHARMFTCPPPSYIATNPTLPYEPKKPDLPNSDLLTLLNLSRKLPLDGEFTPVEALTYIRGHERYEELTMPDFEVLIDNLRDKSRCHGFGAVLEEFEIRDALTSVFSTKTDSLSPYASRQ